MIPNSVAITGIGVVSSIGIGLEPFAEGLLTGRVAGGPLTLFVDADAPPVAEVKGFVLEQHIQTVKTYIDRTSAFALATAAMARRQAQWTLTPEEQLDAGLALGTSWGCMDSMRLYAEKFVNAGPRLVPPLIFTHAYANAPNSLVSIEFGPRGFNVCFSGGHACGLEAIAYAADQIRLGRCRFLLAGAADSLSSFALLGYHGQGRLAAESKPFDASSTGFLLSEGATTLAMEPGPQAGTRALALVAGAGLTRSRDPASSCLQAMRTALSEAALAPEELGLILASGCGDRDQDSAEAQALETLLGASKSAPPIYALKALTGEPMAAGGPMAIAAAILHLQQGALPPSPSKAMARLGRLPPNAGGPRINRPTALVNALSDGGEACSLLVRLP